MAASRSSEHVKKWNNMWCLLFLQQTRDLYCCYKKNIVSRISSSTRFFSMRFTKAERKKNRCLEWKEIPKIDYLLFPFSRIHTFLIFLNFFLIFRFTRTYTMSSRESTIQYNASIVDGRNKLRKMFLFYILRWFTF